MTAISVEAHGGCYCTEGERDAFGPGRHACKACGSTVPAADGRPSPRSTGRVSRIEAPSGPMASHRRRMGLYDPAGR